MKQITLFTMLLIAAFGFSQELPINFDEPSHANFVPAGGNTFDVIQDGTDNVGQTTSGGDQFNSRVDLALETFIDMTTSDKTFTFDFYTSEAVVMTGLFQINNEESGGFPIEMEFTTDGNVGWETITLDFNDATNGFPNQGDPVVYGQYAGLSVFTNFGDTGSSTYWFDDIAGAANGEAVPEPISDISTPAPDPTEADADVLSIFNDDYTVVWTPDYSFGEADFVDIDGNSTIKMDFSIAGWGQGTDDVVDISQYDRVHFDYYVDDRFEPGEFGEQVLFVLIDNEGAVNEYNYELTLEGVNDNETLEIGTWVSVDIPLTFFEDLGFNKEFFFQYKLGTSSDLYSKIVYFDNIYFSSDEPLSTNSFESDQFSAYPNPTLDNWNIKSSNSNIQNVEIFNTLGRLVKEVSANNTEVVIDASDLSSGIYFAKIYNDSNQNNTIKLIKR